jgi:hypothetical protein
MTDKEIQEQIDIINTVAPMVLRSKQASLKFIMDAGIFNDEKKVQRKKKKYVQQLPPRSHRLPQLQ